MAQTITESNLFLTSDNRKPVEISPMAVKAKAKAPPNLAMYEKDVLHPVVQHVLKLAQDAYSFYDIQRNDMKETWEKADEFYWMAQKESRMPELTLAKVSASSFYRITRRLSDGAYLATYQEDMPVKFGPDIDVFDTSEKKRTKAVVASGLNNWARYCMRKTDLKTKAKKSYHSTFKYATHFAYVPYDFEIEKRKRWITEDPNIISNAADGSLIYTHKDTGEILSKAHPPEARELEFDYRCKDHVGYYPLKIENIWADNRIDDLDRQQNFLERGDITRPEIWKEARSGNFKNVERITQLQEYQLYGNDSETENTRITDSGKSVTGSEASEVYERWKVWMILPKIQVKLGKDGKPTSLEWDQNGEERRYLMEIVGNILQHPIIVRLQESPYWSNGIPYIVAHSHDDDSGLYGRGLVNLLEDNMFQEQVAKGQLMDNRTLLNRRPLILQKGRVFEKDMRITHNKTFTVVGDNAIREMQMADLSGTIGNTLHQLQQESEAVGQTPAFMMGQNMGARTSATEFSAIRDQSSAPAMNDIKSLNMQIAGGYMRKLKEYAPQFLDRDIATEITNDKGEELRFMITADEFDGDLYIEEVAVQDFENKATMRQMMTNVIQVLANPIFAPFINIPGVLVSLFKTYSSVFPNPEELINKSPEVIALLQNYLTQAPQAGGPQTAQPVGEPGTVPGAAPENPIAGNPVTGYSEGQIAAGVAGQSRGM